jgi:hypothetical protein
MAAVRGFQQPFTLTGMGQMLHRSGQAVSPQAVERGARVAGATAESARR